MKVSVTLFDTRLLAPAGAGSLRALGELLKFDKLSLPDVLDETGKTRPGIERMDLTLVAASGGIQRLRYPGRRDRR